MRVLLAGSFAAFLILSFVLGLTAEPAAADGGSYVVRVPYKGRALVKSLIEHDIEILAFSRDGFYDVLVNDKELAYLHSLAIPISVVRTPDMVSTAAQLDANLGLYSTYAEMETALTSLATAYSDIAELSSMGTSIEGRTIYVLKISDNVALSEGEPEVLYMGNHHARELMSVDVPLKFAEYLLTNYGIIPEVTDMVDSREIYIAPMINPDGHVYVEQNHSDPDPNQWWRKNRRDNLDLSFGVDLNRNYGYQWGFDDVGSSPDPSNITYRGTSGFSEPETQAVRNFCENHTFILAFSYHSYGELLLYPWAYDALYTDDHDLFFALGDTLTSSNGYFAGNTAMGAIYPVNGDTDDWAYGDTTNKDPIFCFTPEMNTSPQGGFAPPDTLIQPTFDLLLPMNMLLLQLADSPDRVLPPWIPTMYAVDDSYYPHYTVNWSPGNLADPNPVVSYDVIEYKNLGWVAEDPANALSDLWIYDGFELSTYRAFEGSGSYYSEMVNNTSHTMRTATSYMVTAETDTFSAQVWYRIETNFDYAYFEVSTDRGVTWETVPGNITTDYDPYGSNRGNGITGASGPWIEAVFPLTQYLGQELEVRFNYLTDSYVIDEGIYIDIPGPVPTYEEKTIIATGITDTLLAITPHATGDYTYRVRARDAENHLSFWSGSETIAIADITAIGDTPQLASRLGANYPNPFNPVTKIPYTIGETSGITRPAAVSLRIYNVAGQAVATLVDRQLAPGVYEATWNGKSATGDPLPSGVYFARLVIAGEQSFTRKLVLLK